MSATAHLFEGTLAIDLARGEVNLAAIRASYSVKDQPGAYERKCAKLLRDYLQDLASESKARNRAAAVPDHKAIRGAVNRYGDEYVAPEPDPGKLQELASALECVAEGRKLDIAACEQLLDLMHEVAQTSAFAR